MATELIGRWRIEAMELWDQDAVDLVGPGFIDIAGDGVGQLSFIAVAGSIDCRLVTDEGADAVEFSWEGEDDGSPVSGRGSASLAADGQLRGRIFFHLGDDSWFTAHRLHSSGTG